jgi:hypothetical protein
VQLLIASDKNENARACHVPVEMLHRQSTAGEIATALFADIKGWIDSIEDLDPEGKMASCAYK